MKILFNCLTMEKGGAERVISLLANEFSKNNDVCVLTLKKSSDAYVLNKDVKRIYVDKSNYKKDNKLRKLARKMSLARIWRLRNEVLEENPDVIISFLPEPSLRLMFLSKFSQKINRIPKIISIRNDPVREYSNPLVKFVMKVLYKDVDGMVYQTEDARRYFKGIIKTKNQTIILNPIDEKTLLKPKKDEQRKNIIVNVGRLEEQKNQEMLIRAFGRTLESGHDYVLKIYGEGSKRRHLQDLINELGLSDRVFLEGQVDDVIQKINDAKIFALSSYYEGLPNALMEAMAMGLPCISTDCPCGGPRTLIRNGKNGILVKNGDERLLAKNIEELSLNSSFRRELGESAKNILERTEVGRVASEWIKIIERCKK